MSRADVVAPGEGFVNGGRCKPSYAHGMPSRGIVIGEKVVLPSNADGSPVSIGLLLGFMDFVLCHISFEPRRIFFGPMRVIVRGDFACGLRAFIDWWRKELEVVQAVLTDGVTRQRRIP